MIYETMLVLKAIFLVFKDMFSEKLEADQFNIDEFRICDYDYMLAD
jgi:hypothetical protein